MGIFDRLGDVIKSYLNDEDERLFGKERDSRRWGNTGNTGDPDLDAAYEELNEYLNRDPGKHSFWRDDPEDGSRAGAGAAAPEALRQDFAELGVPFGADEEACKAAYKRLLKLHHPDRHAGHPGNMKKATEKSARINASYQRIRKWRETGRFD